MTKQLPKQAAPAEPVAWQGAEEWEQLAWNLCADENGEDACNELVWEGGAIKEPWGDRWLKYEGEAKRMIALVRKYAAPPAAQPVNAGVVEALHDALELARNGLLWYQNAYPDEVNGCDDEAMAQIDAALSAARPAEQVAQPAPVVREPLTDEQADAISGALFGCRNAAYRQQIKDALRNIAGDSNDN